MCKFRHAALTLDFYKGSLFWDRLWVYNYVYSCINKNFCNILNSYDCPLAKFCVKVVVLLDNMPLVFFYFSLKPFKKKFLHSL